MRGTHGYINRDTFVVPRRVDNNCYIVLTIAWIS